MSPTIQRLGIDQLSIAERLELIGLIWDSLTEDDASNDIQDWHRRELELRRASADAELDSGIPWEVVKARLADQS